MILLLPGFRPGPSSSSPERQDSYTRKLSSSNERNRLRKTPPVRGSWPECFAAKGFSGSTKRGAQKGLGLGLEHVSARSGLGSHFTLAADYRCREDFLWDAKWHAVVEFRERRVYHSGDFHPLGNYSTSINAWMGWQFHLPQKGSAVIVTYRNANPTR